MPAGGVGRGVERGVDKEEISTGYLPLILNVFSSRSLSQQRVRPEAKLPDAGRIQACSETLTVSCHVCQRSRAVCASRSNTIRPASETWRFCRRFDILEQSREGQILTMLLKFRVLNWCRNTQGRKLGICRLNWLCLSLRLLAQLQVGDESDIVASTKGKDIPEKT